MGAAAAWAPPGWSHDGQHQRTEDMIASEQYIVTDQSAMATA
jgi:hypothetical protein